MPFVSGLIDNHAHSLLRGFLKLDADGFRACWTESRSPEMISKHVQHHLHYQNMLSDLGDLLGVQGEEAILEKRRTVFLDEAEYARTLFSEAGITTVCVDDGYRTDDMYSIGELQQILGDEVEVKHCRRIETVLERCIVESNSFSELSRSFMNVLFGKNRQIPLAAVKTIMAYRGGFQLEHISALEAEKDFNRVKGQLTEGAPRERRITRGPLYHFFLLGAFEAAGQRNIPVQVHTGIGDDDANLLDTNPALLQKMMKTKAFANTTWILLHCYPYVREAAILCSLYPNVYMDLSLALNLVSPIATKIVEEALACAPASKVLFGSDGHSIPETHWHAALQWRRAVPGLS